jgi:hypothetical protein
MSLILTASQGSDGHLLLRKLFSPRRVGRLPQTSLHDLQDYLLAVSLTRDSKVKPRFLPITVFVKIGPPRRANTSNLQCDSAAYDAAGAQEAKNRIPRARTSSRWGTN